MKKWFPFISMVVIALAATVYLVLKGGDNLYIPHTDDPSVIYKEACVDCHGADGQGDGLLYPAFDYSELDLKLIKDKIAHGDWRMPAFRHIHTDTLDVLARFILDKKYLEKK